MLMNTSLGAAITTSAHCNTNINIVKNNVRLVYSHKNWNILLQKDALKIKQLKPILNKYNVAIDPQY